MHRFPFTCVSIALVVNKSAVVAVVCDPLKGEMFQAVKGFGAYLNNERIHVSGVERLNKALVVSLLEITH